MERLTLQQLEEEETLKYGRVRAALKRYESNPTPENEKIALELMEQLGVTVNLDGFDLPTE